LVENRTKLTDAIRDVYIHIRIIQLLK